MHPSDRARLGSTLEKLRRSLDLPSAEWADRTEDWSARSMMNLAVELNISFDSLMTGEIDYVALSKQRSGHREAIPERYQKAAFSRKRNPLNVFNYLDRFYGRGLRDSFMRRFQITEAAFSNPDEEVNILLLSDVCRSLKEMGFTERQFYSVGLHSEITHQGSKFGQIINRFPNIRDVYEGICEQVLQYIEKNHIYTLTALSASHAVIDCRASSEVLDGLRLRQIGTLETCALKAGTIASYPLYHGLPAATVTESRCVHRGDNLCRFVIEFEDAVLLEAAPNQAARFGALIGASSKLARR